MLCNFAKCIVVQKYLSKKWELKALSRVPQFTLNIFSLVQIMYRFSFLFAIAMALVMILYQQEMINDLFFFQYMYPSHNDGLQIMFAISFLFSHLSVHFLVQVHEDKSTYMCARYFFREWNRLMLPLTVLNVYNCIACIVFLCSHYFRLYLISNFAFLTIKSILMTKNCLWRLS